MHKPNFLVSAQRIGYLWVVCALVFLTGCARVQPRLETVQGVDLNRFMGKWYVIAAIPVFIEAKAYNETEEYSLLPDGSINTVLTFNQGSNDGPVKRYNPRGFVRDAVHNSTWAMQFIWPIKAEYLIIGLSEDYQRTVIGRNKRDYVWLMARTSSIPEEDYARFLADVARWGYDVAKIRKVPHQ
ncbi:MAG: lipocalin family protein [Candidatus Omnitrophica bacterium]|nr:lipocalin family protein [Candidatus Omnitrophota bacterium]